MAGGGTTGLDKLFAICATPQNTELDAVALAALTYVNVDKCTEIGSFHKLQENATVGLLSGNTAKAKGQRDAGEGTVAYTWTEGDPGQTIMATAGDSSDCYAMRITYGNGTVRYCQGLVMPFDEGSATANDFEIRTHTVALTVNFNPE